MPLLRQQESRAPVDECCGHHLEEELKARRGGAWSDHVGAASIDVTPVGPTS